MVIQQPAYRVSAKQAALRQRLRGQRIAHEIMQFVPHPHPERNIEALLRAVQDFARQAILESFFDQPLAFAIVQFMPRRNGEGPFYESMIEKRDPRLEPVRPRHPIHLRPHLVYESWLSV